ncbi:MAG: M16 family metallopeptidase [Planctomycetota bacterium]
MTIKPYQEIQFPPLEEFTVTQPRIHTLANGLKIYLLEDHEIPLVKIRSMIRVGSAWEPAEKVGLASICAHSMRTGGTATNPGDHVDDELGAMAASIDVSIGGLSGRASAGCLASGLKRVLELFSDILRNPAFPDDKIELSKSALRTGISRRNDQIGSMAQRAFQIAMFGKTSPFAREPEYATVDAITRRDLQQFHHQYFRAGRVMIGFVGDFESERVLELVTNLFGDWKTADTPMPPVTTNPLPIDGRKVFFAEKNDVNQTNLYVGGFGIRRDDPDWPALRIGSFVLGSGGFASRLMKKVRTELGLAYSVGGGFGAEYDRIGLFRASCQTKTQSTARALEAILNEIESLLKNPPTHVEVELAKDQILNAEVFEYDPRPQILGRRMTLDYYNYPANFMEQANHKIRTITPADVAAAIQRNLNINNLTLVAVGNKDGMDKPISSFGPVTTLDLSIPPP